MCVLYVFPFIAKIAWRAKFPDAPVKIVAPTDKLQTKQPAPHKMDSHQVFIIQRPTRFARPRAIRYLRSGQSEIIVPLKKKQDEDLESIKNRRSHSCGL
jgi:hypothetical protein